MWPVPTAEKLIRTAAVRYGAGRGACDIIEIGLQPPGNV